MPSRPRERLHHYSDLIAWTHQGGLLTQEQADDLLEQAARHAMAAQQTFKRALQLRETLYRIISALARDFDAGGGGITTAP